MEVRATAVQGMEDKTTESLQVAMVGQIKKVGQIKIIGGQRGGMLIITSGPVRTKGVQG